MAELTQQVFEYVFTQYGTQPEYLWKTHPDYAVLRHADNRKWYTIVMNVEKSSLGLREITGDKRQMFPRNVKFIFTSIRLFTGIPHE